MCGLQASLVHISLLSVHLSYKREIKVFAGVLGYYRPSNDSVTNWYLSARWLLTASAEVTEVPVEIKTSPNTLKRKYSRRRVS